MILENLEVCFQKFKQDVNVIKESDIEKIQTHIKKLKDENLRLENEIKRLNFVIESFINESEIKEIDGVQEILKKKIKIEKKKKREKEKK